MSPQLVCEVFDALLDGLQDYTLDERGDVGSWVRMACIRGLTTFVEVLFSNATSIPHFTEYLPAAKYHAAISGILRQGVERLDNVRQVSGEHIVRLLSLPLPTVLHPELWQIEGEALMRDLFMRYPILFLISQYVYGCLTVHIHELATRMTVGRMVFGYFRGPLSY